MKGIILAGGRGTRLYPSTAVISKQLLQVYDKPMIYYPLSTLMLAGINEIALISTSLQQSLYQELLGDGSKLGINITYFVQDEPNGIAEAFLLVQDFIRGANVALILGDNIFYGNGLSRLLINVKNSIDGATLFAHQVKNPEQFGIVEINEYNEPVSIQEKPNFPKSRLAITGLYFYDSSITEVAKSIKPSDRGELEITDVNNIYLKQGNLSVKIIGRGYTWFDAGTPDDLLEAANFIYMVEKRQGVKVGCLEEISLNNQWITSHDLTVHNQEIGSTEYGKYINQVLTGVFLE